MHIRLNFHLHENNQRSIKNTTGCKEQISVYTVYISRSNYTKNFRKNEKS